MKKLFLFLIAISAINSAMAQCSPTFTYSANPAGSSLLQMQFVNTTSFTPTGSEMVSYTYNFGDGSSGDGSGTENYTYASTSTYTVTLTMTVFTYTGIDTVIEGVDTIYYADTICTNSSSQSVTVAYPECGTLVSSSLVSSSTTDEVVDFSSSTPSGATMTSYLWNFGDGSTSTLATPSHTYTAAADYSVTLTASDASCIYTNGMDLPVSGIYSCSSDSVFVSASASGLFVSFNCLNTSPVFGQTCAYAWNFGDGSSADGSDTSSFGDDGIGHDYSAAGTYTVTVTVNYDSSESTSLVECSVTGSYVITVAPLPPPNRISGNIMFDGPPIDTTGLQIKVWLITYDSSTSLLTAVDSTAASGSTGYYEFLSEPNGEYRVKAYDSSATSGPGYVPTYSYSNMHWDSAYVINHSGGDDTANIAMLYGTVTSGTGFIGGSVLAGADIHPGGGERTTTSYTPVSGVLISLYNASGTIIAYTYTDGSGNYSFSSLPLGSYFVYPEVLNYKTTPYTGITLTSSSASATSAGFVEHTISRTITPTGGTTTISNISAEVPKMNVYPNPTKGVVNISWQQSADENAQVVISDVTGREVYNANINITAGTGGTRINLSELVNGLYIVRVKAADVDYEQKVVLQR